MYFLILGLISSEEIMVQSGQLSEPTDSGSRVFEEQPLLEESFTIHLGASYESKVFGGSLVAC